MQLCDPSPNQDLAVKNCKALAIAGVVPVLVRLARCGVHQLQWGSVLCLGSIAAFDNSTDARNKHLIRRHGGIAMLVSLLGHESSGLQKLAACALTNLAHNAWPDYGTLSEEIAIDVRLARSEQTGLAGFEMLLKLLQTAPAEV